MAQNDQIGIEMDQIVKDVDPVLNQDVDPLLNQDVDPVLNQEMDKVLNELVNF